MMQFICIRHFIENGKSKKQNEKVVHRPWAHLVLAGENASKKKAKINKTDMNYTDAASK